MKAFDDPVLVALVEVLERAGTAFFVIHEVEGALGWRYISQPYARLIGFTIDELTATPVLSRIVDEQQAAMRELSVSFLGGGAMPAMLEVTIKHASGELFQVETTFARAASASGSVGVVMVHDKHAASPQLGLLEADRISLVGALAAGFAHEINNPLTSVLLNLRSLRKQLLAHHPEASQPQALRCVDDITTGAERIASNVRAFQTLATRGATTRIDLAAVVASALRLAAPTLEARAHVIRQIFPVTPVRGEESRIGQAVLAMLMFAISGFDDPSATFSPEGVMTNRVVVLVEDRATDVVVEVSDNGRALTAEELRRAFDPFFRSSVRGAGVGVGLGVARSVAATLGGEVALAMRAGGGAVITMRLPPES